MKQFHIILLLVLLLCKTAAGYDLIIQGADGELCLYNNNGTSTTFTPEIPRARARIEDSYYDSASHTLLSSLSKGLLCECRPLDEDPKYVRIDDGKSWVLTVVVDSQKRPIAIDETSTSGTYSRKLLQREKGAWVDYTGGRLQFERLVTGLDFFPEGTLTKAQLVAKYPFIESTLTSFTAKSEWVVKGRNDTVDLYSLVIADTPVGQPLRGRYLVVDLSDSRGHLIALSDYSPYVYLFKHHIVIRAENVAISGTYNGMEDPSGDFYVYDLQSFDLKRFELGKKYRVLAATRDHLYLGKGTSVYAQPIGSAKGEVRLLATLDFAPLKVFPLNEN